MTRRSDFSDVVIRALERELAARRELRAHAQLALAPDAPVGVVEDAFRRLVARYDATAFAEHGAEAVAAATEITELIRSAYESMRDPHRRPSAASGEQLFALRPARRDETCQALQTLRAAIERRLREAESHEAAGRTRDAIRLFESVVVLDRQNATAREALRRLRLRASSKRPNTFSRMFGRLLRTERPPLTPPMEADSDAP